MSLPVAPHLSCYMENEGDICFTSTFVYFEIFVFKRRLTVQLYLPLHKIKEVKYVGSRQLLTHSSSTLKPCDHSR